MSDVKNKSVINAAKSVLVGGVNSPVRSFSYVGGDPVPIKRGRKAMIYDYEDKEYVDYVLSYGALILGHAHPGVTDAIKKAVASGSGFGATHATEVRFAEDIRKAIRLMEKIRFVNSGTEAVMGAVRLARGFTGRDKIIKFDRSYHGHADYLLAKAGSGPAGPGLPASKGVPCDFTRHTIVAPYGDRSITEGIFTKYGSYIAAVLVEPVGGNSGVVLPDVSFLKKLRAVTRKYKTLLIFDEVITGFRFSYGSAADGFGIKPDIICLGKIIGGGLPIGAYGGSKSIMSALAPEGGVYQASTFAGNPVVMAAGAAALRQLRSAKKLYPQTAALAKEICETIENEARKKNVVLKTAHYGSIFSIAFAQKDEFRYFYRKLLSAGVFFASSQHEANFVSFAHTIKVLEKTKNAIKHVFHNWKKKELI